MNKNYQENFTLKEHRLIKELPSFPWEKRALKKRALLPNSGERRARLQK
jgi:hypothetical protein